MPCPIHLSDRSRGRPLFAAHAARSPVHAFHLLRALPEAFAPPDLRAKVRLCLLLDPVSDSRSAVVQMDLTPMARLSSLNIPSHKHSPRSHSLAFQSPPRASAGSHCALRYASAPIPSDALTVLADVLPLPFFLSLVSAMLTYAEPPSALPFLSSARAALPDSDPLSHGPNGCLAFFRRCDAHGLRPISCGGRSSTRPRDSPPPEFRLSRVRSSFLQIPGSLRE
jgi:hypothetical protein